jgi:hypothetical protein
MYWGDGMSLCSDPKAGQSSNTSKLYAEPYTRTDVGNNVHLDTAGEPVQLGNPHRHRGKDSAQMEDEHRPQLEDTDQGAGQDRDTEGGEHDPIILEEQNNGPHLHGDDQIMRTKEEDAAPAKNEHPRHVMDLDDGDMMIKSVYYHTNFMVYSRRQMNEN